MSHPIQAPVPAPAHGWTPERKALFLDRLSAHGNARAACRSVGLSAEAAYKLRRRDVLFARAWAAAVVLGRDASIQALAERAVEGVEEEIYYRGELIGTRRRYDSRLLLAHLARLDRLADESGAGADAGRFDELVACIAADDGEEPPPADRDAAIEAAAEIAAADHRRRELNAYHGRSDDGQNDAYGDDDHEPDDFWDEFCGILDKECKELAQQARVAAAAEWDGRWAKAIATVDALGSRSDVLPDLPNRPFRTGAITGLPSRESGGELSFPCTLSTASTTALARTIADPPPGWATAPRFPFTAPPRPEV